MTDSGVLSGLILTVTSECNLHCRYCFQDRRSSRRMDSSVLKSAVDLTLSAGPPVLRIFFTGGEPLLEFPLICAAVRHAEERCAPRTKLEFRISTNGTLLDDEVLSFLDAHRFEIQLSFDGIPPAQDLRATGSFALLDRLLGRLPDDYPILFHRCLKICITLSPAGIPWLADSIRYFSAKGIRRISITPTVDVEAGPAQDCGSELDSQFRQIVDVSLDFYHSTGKIPLLHFLPSARSEVARRRGGAICSVPSGRSVVVDVDAQVYKCPLLAESCQRLESSPLALQLRGLRVGDIRDPDLYERLSSLPKKAERLEIFHHREQKYSSHARCADCRYLRRCVICPVAIARIPGNTDPCLIPDFYCAYNRSMLKYRDIFLHEAGL